MKRTKQQEEWPDWTRPPQPLICPICLHEYDRRQLTKHHLIPKSRKGKETVLVCRPCHKQIHVTFSEKELERNYSTIEALLAAPEFQTWVAWIRKRKPGSRIRARKHRRRR